MAYPKPLEVVEDEIISQVVIIGGRRFIVETTYGQRPRKRVQSRVVESKPLHRLLPHKKTKSNA